jgi:hypothetical protein
VTPTLSHILAALNRAAQAVKDAANADQTDYALAPVEITCQGFVGDGDFCTACGDARRWHRPAV